MFNRIRTIISARKADQLLYLAVRVISQGSELSAHHREQLNGKNSL